ncbi:MAG: NADP-dependent malic enzyme [Alphaproteobacteria bacterium]|nr:NADP-dependent malic enzyme [Alphaproteobacteria bacterium]
MADELDEMAMEYHEWPTPGKIAVVPTKRLANQRDLALAYSPGVAAACRAITEDSEAAVRVTARGNLVAVVTNGTAVLGLGEIGPLASKPVMEGKAVLFKKFAGIDVFDLELDECDPEKLVEIIAAMEPTFGGINIEDVKAPECFTLERMCRERMNIPVFHDDQHGTAICVAAAVYNGLRLVEKEIEQARIVCCGAGAAGLACLDLLVSLGARPENIVLTDIHGVVYEGREEDMDPYKSRYALATEMRSLADAVVGRDIFLGLSAAGVLAPEMVATMAARPLILALANPDPEILPEEAKRAKPDALIATGRSDYPNQVNNVLCFPFLFRGALDVGATTINEEMKLAAARAIAELATVESSDIVVSAYGDEQLNFGPDYFIPKPLDPRLILWVAPAVARAAMESGVATRPIPDFDAYVHGLERHVYRTGLVMRPLFDRARHDPRRLVYAEGEGERVLRAVQICVDDGIVRPVLVGDRQRIEARIQEFGLRLQVGRDVEVVDPQDYDAYESYAAAYHGHMGRRGISPQHAGTLLRTRATLIAAMMVANGDADAMICGTTGRFDRHFRHVNEVVGRREGVSEASALELLLAGEGAVFICDTAVSYNPSAEQIAEMTLLAAEHVRRFGMTPKVALLSHSDFGSHDTRSAKKMRRARDLIKELAPQLMVEGELRADTALVDVLRERLLPDSELEGMANLLVMPSLDAANIAFNLARVIGNGISVGPMLIGMANPAHVVSPAITVRGLVNMTAISVVEAQVRSVDAAEAVALSGRG